jgi:hypothetical protein
VRDVLESDAHGGRLYARHDHCKSALRKGGDIMLWTIIAILLILWLLGLITSYTFGGLLHIILVVAIILLVIQLLSGRRRL